MSSKTNQSIGTIKSVFADAADDGIVSEANKDLMCVSLDDNILAGCDGLNIDDIEATEVVLVSLLIDDSGSMDSRIADTLAGQHAMLDSLSGSKQKDSFLFGMWTLNRSQPYHSYVKLENVLKLSENDYQPNGGTPLCDRWFEMLTANVAYAQQLRSSGIAVRSIAVVITDGDENESRRFHEAECAALAKDLLKSEQFILGFVGVGDEAYFRGEALKMGFPDGGILTAKDGPSAMRKVFNVVSQSVIRASQAKIDPAAAQNNFFNVN